MNLMKQYFGSKIFPKKKSLRQSQRRNDITAHAAKWLWGTSGPYNKRCKLLVETSQHRKRASNLETPTIREVSQPVLDIVIAKFLTSHCINTKQQVTCCDVTLGYVSSYVGAFSVFIDQQEKMFLRAFKIPPNYLPGNFSVSKFCRPRHIKLPFWWSSHGENMRSHISMSHYAITVTRHKGALFLFLICSKFMQVITTPSNTPNIDFYVNFHFYW